MQKIVNFAQANNIEITNETLSGILLDIVPLQGDGTTVCDIADLNKIGVDVIMERAGQEPKYVVQGYLEDILVGLYAQSTKYALNKVKRVDGYKVMLDLAPAVIKLKGKDVLRVKLRAENIAFTLLNNGNSSISVETIPAFGNETRLPILKQFPLGAGETMIDKELGNDVVKITLLTDLTTDYFSSVKAKPVNVDIFANGYEKSVSENLVAAENIHYMDYNPATPIQDLVVYTGKPLDAVRIKSKLDSPADASAKVLVISLNHI